MNTPEREPGLAAAGYYGGNASARLAPPLKRIYLPFPERDRQFSDVGVHSPTALNPRSLHAGAARSGGHVSARMQYSSHQNLRLGETGDGSALPAVPAPLQSVRRDLFRAI